MKKIITLLLCAATFSAAQGQEINDANTPLHLMQPKYSFQYAIPSEQTIKQDIDRVLSFLEQAMPTEIADGRLKQGGFRLTSYESGVMYSAIEDAALRTGDDRYMQFSKQRLEFLADFASKVEKNFKKDPDFDKQMKPMLFPAALDDCGAMCAAYCRLSLRTGKQYDDVINRYINRVKSQYRIGDDNIFARTRPHTHTVWLDDMYMGIPPLAWYGALKGDASAIQEAVEQIRAFKRRMWMPEWKLFRHGWVQEMQSHPFFPWGRANGWAILTMCEVLDAMKQMNYNGPEREEVIQLLRQHIDGICALQDKSGLWHQLLNDPTSYLETSASAIYTYCMAHAICEGWIDALTYGAQTLIAWQAVSTQINERGQVMNTCVGTGMGFEPAFYCHRPVHPMAAHGYGPTIWAGSEMIRMLRMTHPKMNDSAIHFYNKEQTTNQPIFSEEQ